MRRCLLLFMLINLAASCQQSENKFVGGKSDISLEIERVEQELFNLNIDSIDSEILQLKMKYGDFFKLYAQQVLRLGQINSPNFSGNLKMFITDYSVYQGFREIESIYPDIDFLERDLLKAFDYYINYFPTKTIPEIYTVITGFNQSIIIDEDILAIGLDKYLGRSCEFYDRLMISSYLKRNMHKNMVIPDCMKAWAISEFQYNDSIDNLISNMIYNGKIHYFQQMVLPGYNDTLIMGFTGDQMEWCLENEKQMWQYLVENKLLFESNFLTIKKFTEPAPFTKNFSPDSPGRAVNWLGWQIVRRYMKKNQEITLKQLMYNNNYQEILQKAKYRP